MLKKIAKGDKGKKQGKKQVKNKKQEKVQKAPEVHEEEQENTDLIHIDYDQKEEKKVKQTKKRNQYQLEEKQIDASKIQIQKKEEKKKPITSWVMNSVEEVNPKDFNMNEVDHHFESLNDQHLNQKLKQKKQKIEQQKKNQPFESNGIMFKPLERTQQQIKMDQADNLNIVKSNEPTTGILPGSSKPGMMRQFVNTAEKSNFQELTKSPQQLRFEKAEQNMMELKKAPQKGWLGAKKTTEETKPATFKPSNLNFTNTALNTKDQGGVKVVELEQGGSRRRNEPELIFLSKEERQRRKKIREERQKKQA